MPSQSSQLGKRRRSAFYQKSKKQIKRRRTTMTLRRPFLMKPQGEIKCSTGCLYRTRLTMLNGETERPWYLISAATTNKGERNHNQQVINGIRNGVASFERIGRKILNKNLAIRLKIQSGAQRDVAVRYVLVMKKDLDNKSVADQGLATDDNNPFYNRGTDVDGDANNEFPSDYANINPIMQWRDLSNIDQFVILLDKTVILKQNWNSNNAPVPDGRSDFVPVPNGRWTTDQVCDPNPYGATVTDGVPMATVYKEHYLDLSKLGPTTAYDEVEDQASSGQYGYVEKNGIYLIAATDYTTNDNLDPAVEISGTYRFRYID